MSSALCYYAFDSLCAALTPGHLPYSLDEWQVAFPDSVDIQSPSPLFVTYTADNRLRGCIGTFAPTPLETGVKRFALTAALQDTRFDPVTPAELNPQFEVSITLLTGFKPISSCLDWELGTHGLQLEMDISYHEYHGTFLPSVALEQGWDQYETLLHLLVKAKYPGAPPKDVVEFYDRNILNGSIRLVKYLGLKELASYDEFVKARTAL